MEQDTFSQVDLMHAAKEGARLGVESFKTHVKNVLHDFRIEMMEVNKRNKTKILLARTSQESQAHQMQGHLLLRDANTSKKIENAILAMGKIALESVHAAIENEFVKPELKN